MRPVSMPRKKLLIRLKERLKGVDRRVGQDVPNLLGEGPRARPDVKNCAYALPPEPQELIFPRWLETPLLHVRRSLVPVHVGSLTLTLRIRAGGSECSYQVGNRRWLFYP